MMPLYTISVLRVVWPCMPVDKPQSGMTIDLHGRRILRHPLSEHLVEICHIWRVVPAVRSSLSKSLTKLSKTPTSALVREERLMTRLTLNDGRRNEVSGSRRWRIQSVEGLLYGLQCSGNRCGPQVHMVCILQNGRHETKLIHV
jgi:hypothetical protein